ncbi:MAG: hypothetical protein WAV32_04435 [Halobacteriota archaeon]
MFALICEEAAAIVLVGQHLVDLVDFDLAEVIFFCKAKYSAAQLILTSNNGAPPR